MTRTEEFRQAVVDQFCRASGLSSVPFEVKARADGDYLVLSITNPTERFFTILNQVLAGLPEENPYRERTTIIPRNKSVVDRLALPETQLLRRVLSESLTVTRHTFEDDFFARYTPSVLGVEDEIVGETNHLVFGRRGSGKSSLIAYLYHTVRRRKVPRAWLAMQTYAGRSDVQVIADVFIEILEQMTEFGLEGARELAQLNELSSAPSGDLRDRLDRLLPSVRRAIGKISERHGRAFLFLDDIHVVAPELQPLLLAKLYSISRDNRVFLKISGVEQFTRNWDAGQRLGLEPRNDAQIVRLDYNLTMPDKSLRHIAGILEAHAKYCGLPGVDFITGKGVLERLVWVAAAVPRDALSLFAQAISRASVSDQKRVSITSVNTAASEMLQEKMNDVEKDASGRFDALRDMLERIRTFCVIEQRKNAFLVEILNDHPEYGMIQSLIALRLLHVMHEGITPSTAGRRFIALMLDYGFYVGIRAARSVDLFQKEPKPLPAKELRSLPVLELSK